MTLEDMKEMPLHEWAGRIRLDYAIQRVPHGWMYIYHEGDRMVANFVPEMLPIQEYVLPRGER